MNTSLLLKVKRAILRHPKNVDMGSWFNHKDDIAPCGTTGCLGGWVVALGSIRKLRSLVPGRHGISFTEDKAMALLDINEDQAGDLFSLQGWPIHIRQAYCESHSRERQAKAMADMIDWFIEHQA